MRTSGAFRTFCPVVWPRWVPFAYSALATVLVGVTVALRPAGWPLGAAVLLIVWVGCLVRLPGARPVWIALLVAGCTLLATPNNNMVLFVVVVTCGEIAIELPVAPAAGLLALALVTLVARSALQSHLDYAVPWGLGYLAMFGGATGARNQWRLTAELQANQGLVAAEAAATERRRLAREIHDVIATR